MVLDNLACLIGQVQFKIFVYIFLYLPRKQDYRVTLQHRITQLQWHVSQGKKGRKKDRIGYMDKNKRLDKCVLHGSRNLCWTLKDVAIQTLKPIFTRLIPMLLQRKARHNRKARFF